MNKHWIALTGALLVGFVVGCSDDGAKVTVPENIPPRGAASNANKFSAAGPAQSPQQMKSDEADPPPGM